MFFYLKNNKNFCLGRAKIESSQKSRAVARPAIFRDLRASRPLTAIFKGARIYNRSHSPRSGAGVRKLGCAAQKCDFACAVNYLGSSQKVSRKSRRSTMSAFPVSFGGSAAFAAIFRGAQIYNGGNSHRGGERVRKLGCAAQKRGFACAVNYLKGSQKCKRLCGRLHFS